MFFLHIYHVINIQLCVLYNITSTDKISLVQNALKIATIVSILLTAPGVYPHITLKMVNAQAAKHMV